MATELQLGETVIDVVFKDIKNLHLSVHPPSGRARIAAPDRMNMEAVRLFAISKIGWIRRQQQKLQEQARETPREFIERESHYLWGKRYLLRLVDERRRSPVAVSHQAIELSFADAKDSAARETALSEFYRRELRARARPLIAKWERALGVEVDRFYVQKMRTKWGSSTPSRQTIRLNLELAKFPPECLDYVVLHEIAHFRVPNHSEAFLTLLDQHLPGWRALRDRLNEGPLPAYE